jgi:large subunit ribosomal protein L21
MVGINSNNVFSKYAIFEIGSKQYQAIEGKTIAIEKIEGDINDHITFDKILIRKISDNDVEIGKPYLKTPIRAQIIKHIKGPKVIVFKFKRRKKYRKKQGHRQNLTVIRILSI